MTLQRSIVGIGASAGGLEAFHYFFENMAADSGLAFVVILHLPIAHKSMLSDILGRWTNMAVIDAIDGTRIENNCVYVPPPHSLVKLKGGCLHIQMPEPDAPREHRPIDVFFDSLAAAGREDAVGIVLSGTGTDGSLGLKAIKECGGTTFAQKIDHRGTLHAGMPEGAIATGAVDYVLPVEEMPAHLVRLKSLRFLEVDPSALLEKESEEARLAICGILRARLGHDFSGYKDKTFMRRVQRRMQAQKLTSLSEYVLRLGTDQEEASLLFHDLLVRVTSFFRDADAFAVLERLVMPRLFAGKNPDGLVRVWVPGCATGEEAYSLAMLLREYMDKATGSPKVQVFATDVDESAITIARSGRYPPTLVDGLSAERLHRFFHASPSGYLVTREIRELCTFSPHSIIKEPPFSRMDLISCRNLLIYMDLEQQAAVFPVFYYALAPGGVLLLGRSESITRHEQLFEPLDKASRIYAKRDGQRQAPSFPRWEGKQKRSAGPNRPPTGLTQTQLSTHAVQDPGSILRPDTLLHARSWADDPAPFAKVRAAFHQMIKTKRLPLLNSEDPRSKLVATHTKLLAITEEHQSVVEELRSANEELHSVNEELQSTNEELETSKEEIQSINEELQTVNARLSEKVDELDRNNSDLRNLFESTQIATIFLDRHLIIRSFTPAVATIYNLIPSDQGRPLTDIVSKLRYDEIGADVFRVLHKLEPLERRVAHNDGQRHFLMRILPYRAPDSTVSGALVTFLDVTSVVTAEQHQRLLVDELNHRVKNMLTIVVSLAAQTLKRSTSLDEFAAAFMGRVHALTASYTLLASENWLSVDLQKLLLEATKPFVTKGHAKVTIRGPVVRLAPPGAMAIGMVVYELATNALKYGALSVPEGHVEASWYVQDNPEQSLVLQWLETNGPAVKAPTHHGFGTRLLQRGIAHELSGTVNLRFEESGLRATITAPIKTTVPLGQAAGS